jgi:PAS domain-containing protein
MEKNYRRSKKLNGQSNETDEIILRVNHDWEDIFDNITDMVTIHDKDFNIIRANKAAEKILGASFLKKCKVKML